MQPFDLTVTVDRSEAEAEARILDRVDTRLRACGLARHRVAGAVQYRPRFIGLPLWWAFRRLRGEQVTFTFEPRGRATEVRAAGKLRDRAHAELTEALGGS